MCNKYEIVLALKEFQAIEEIQFITFLGSKFLIKYFIEYVIVLSSQFSEKSWGGVS